jgi:cytoskeleton protein RodZ
MSPSEEANGAESTGPGETLRRARELQGLSVQQAAERLNLDVVAVEALESDRFEALGAPVFAKGHLRRYAGLLGLQSEEVLASYERSPAPHGQPTLVPKSHGEFTAERQRPRWPWVVGGLLLFLLAAALVAYVGEYGFELPKFGTRSPAADTGGPAESAESRVAVAGGDTVLTVNTVRQPGPETTAADAPAASPTPAALATSDAQSSAVGVAGPGQLSVSLSFATDSWVEIYDGSGQAVFYDLGRAGTERSFVAAAPLSVTLGNAAGVGLRVNGRSLELPGVAPGETVARFRVTPDGALQ